MKVKVMRKQTERAHEINEFVADLEVACNNLSNAGISYDEDTVEETLVELADEVTKLYELIGWELPMWVQDRHRDAPTPDMSNAKFDGDRPAEEGGPDAYLVKLEIDVDPVLFDDAAQVELWVEAQLSKDPDVAMCGKVSAEAF